ncbi:MAG: efflux RND transporter periplasmic adaptor subunit [Candidatus Tritonobacter lacicola]|nr:efflux RND transporter periplasmic adaptor subunit [Candidatus Tritonobacter lacicola]
MTGPENKLKFLTLAIALVLLASTVTGCKGKKEAAPNPPTVTVATPVEKNVQTYAEFTGYTAAVESVDIRARVRGFLDKVAFEDAARVKKGDLLFIIEQAPYKAQRDQTKAELASARAELERAQIDLKRVEVAAKTNAVSQEEVTNRRAQRDVAAAAVDEEKAKLEQARLNLGYTEVRSPIDGRVSRRLVDEGNLVGAGENTLLTTIVTMDPIYVYFEVDERTLIKGLKRSPRAFDNKKDYPFYVGLDTEKGYPHKGVLDYFSNIVDQNTGTITARGVLPNKEKELYPGMFARVRVPAEVASDALLVHEKAIGTDLGGKYLYIVKSDNTVEQHRVELGPLDGEMRVISEGIKKGERYIVNGLQFARPGLPVTPKKEEEKPSAKAVPQKQGAAGEEEAKPDPSPEPEKPQ